MFDKRCFHRVIAAVAAVVMLISLSACGAEPETAETAGERITRDYVSGYWTDGKTNHLFLQQSVDGMYFMLETTLQNAVDSSGIFLLEGDSLYGVVSKQTSEEGEADTALEKEKVFTFNYTDDNTMQVMNAFDGSETLFIRDNLVFDSSRLEDEYVFWTIDRAAQFLSGQWTDKDSKYFIVGAENGGAQWTSDLSFPECDSVDFCDYKMVSVNYGEDGTKSFVPVYSFHILDKDHVMLTSLTEDFESEFRREPSDISEVEDLNDYVFFNLLSTISFIQGRWEEESGHYFFNFEINDGQPNWKTNLRMHTYDSYNFSGNTILGTKGDEESVPVFDFKIIDLDTIEIYSYAKEECYNLHRIAD